MSYQENPGPLLPWLLPVYMVKGSNDGRQDEGSKG
jgi:hypothetical protein